MYLASRQEKKKKIRVKLHPLIGPYTDKEMAKLFFFGKNCLSLGRIKFAGGIRVPGIFASNALIY